MKSQAVRLLAFALAALSIFSLIRYVSLNPGNGSKPSGNQPAKQAPVTSPPSRIVVTFDKPDSGVELRRNFYVTNPATGREARTKTEIHYRDHRVGCVYYRADGKTPGREEEYFPGGTRVKTRVTYAADGTTITSCERYHENGNLWLESKSFVDGRSLVTTYRADGKTILSVAMSYPDCSGNKVVYRKDGKTVFDTEVDYADGTKQITYYRPDGKTLWAKYHIAANGSGEEVDAFDTAGKYLYTIVVTDHFYRADVIFHRPNGTVLYKQSYRLDVTLTRSGSLQGHYVLASVGEFKPDGTTLIRSLVLDDTGSRVIKVHIFDRTGNLTSTRYLNADRSWEHEEFLDGDGNITSIRKYDPRTGQQQTIDASGKVTKTEKYDPSKAREVIEDGHLKALNFDDPTKQDNT